MECTFSKWKFKKGSGPVPQQLAASPKGKNCKPHCPDPFLQHMSLASRPGNAVEFRSIARVNRDHLDAGFPECAKSTKKCFKKNLNPASCRRKQFVEVETLPKDAPVMRSQQLILGPLRLVFSWVFPAFPTCVCYKYFPRVAQQKCSAILHAEVLELE